MRYIHFFIILWLSLSVYSVVIASTVDEDIQRIHDAYLNIHDIKGSFIQKSYLKDLKRTDTYRGNFYVKIPSMMRWEYKGEKPQEVIINNDRILIYKRTEKQAYKGVFNKQTYGQAPLALLSGFGNIKEEFNISKNKEDGKLILIPNFMGSIGSIELETSDSGFPIRSFVIKDTHRNRIEFTLKDIEINTEIKDSVFDLLLPEGVNIYEYNP